MCSRISDRHLGRRVTGRHAVDDDAADRGFLLVAQLADLVHPVLVEEGSDLAVALAEVDLEAGAGSAFSNCATGCCTIARSSGGAAARFHHGEQPVDRHAVEPVHAGASQSANRRSL